MLTRHNCSEEGVLLVSNEDLHGVLALLSVRILLLSLAPVTLGPPFHLGESSSALSESGLVSGRFGGTSPLEAVSHLGLQHTWEEGEKISASEHMGVVFVSSSVRESVCLLRVVSSEGVSGVTKSRVVLPDPLAAIGSREPWAFTKKERLLRLYGPSEDGVILVLDELVSSACGHP